MTKRAKVKAVRAWAIRCDAGNVAYIAWAEGIFGLREECERRIGNDQGLSPIRVEIRPAPAKRKAKQS